MTGALLLVLCIPAVKSWGSNASDDHKPAIRAASTIFLPVSILYTLRSNSPSFLSSAYTAAPKVSHWLCYTEHNSIYCQNMLACLHASLMETSWSPWALCCHVVLICPTCHWSSWLDSSICWYSVHGAAGGEVNHNWNTTKQQSCCPYCTEMKLLFDDCTKTKLSSAYALARTLVSNQSIMQALVSISHHDLWCSLQLVQVSFKPVGRQIQVPCVCVHMCQ